MPRTVLPFSPRSTTACSSAIPALTDRFRRFCSRQLVDVATPTCDSSTDFVAASLGVKPDQVKAWISGTPNLAISDFATLDNLSRVYAAASLCRALQIAPEALADIVGRYWVVANPFRTLPAPTTPNEVVEQFGLERELCSSSWSEFVCTKFRF